MDERLKEAFDAVRAEERCKENTMAYVRRKTRGFTRPRVLRAARLLPVAACLVLVLLGAGWLYATPTVSIYIDVNPSVELAVNRFDRVVSATGRNDDGQALLESLDLRNLDCTQAVEELLQAEPVASLLESGQALSIGVVGGDGGQAGRVLAQMESCTQSLENTHCCLGEAGEVEAARELGLSYGKYRALLALQALDPTVTAGDVQALSTGQIWAMVEALEADDAGDAGDTGSGQGNGAGQQSGQQQGCETQSGGQGSGAGQQNGAGHDGEHGHGRW